MRKPWLIYALITTGFWGVWGAFAEFPTRHGFPETLVYVVWTLTMIPPALYAMQRVGWRVQRDSRSVLLGALIGFTGAGGQMLLFHAVHTGPTYLIFPIIALSPVVTIGLSMVFLKERVSKVGALGVLLVSSLWTVNDFTGQEVKVASFDNFRTIFTNEVYRAVT